MKAPVVWVTTTLLVGALSQSASGDWIVLRGGAASRVQGFEVTDRSVDMVMLNGESWSVALFAVDLPGRSSARGRSCW